MNNNSNQQPNKQFDSLGLDQRLVKALLKSGFIKPTAVQLKSIPIALQKKDILMRAKTGSGKTLAYSIPLIENIIRSKSQLSSSSSNTNNGPKALILAPTQELIYQIDNVLSTLLIYCNDIIKHLSLTQHGKHSLINEKPRLLENNDILICTPSRLVNHLSLGNVTLTNISHIIIDEADLIITHDFESDIKKIVLNLPSNKHRAQIIMCSATLNPNTSKLQEFFLMHHPTIIDIDGTNGNQFNQNKLTEYYFQSSNVNDKFLVMYALFKLNIINGKCIIFVHNIDLSYRLKLFLEKFLISTAVLNPKLPFNSRQSVIDKFNRGLFKYLITTDAINEHDDKKNIKNYWKFPSKVAAKDNETIDNDKDENENDNDSDAEMVDGDSGADNNNDDEYEFEQDEDDTGENDDESKTETPDKNKQKRDKNWLGLCQQKGLMAYRGVDFREVAAVINFSAPFSLKKYIHRIGRTARGGNYGVGITLVTPKEMKRFQNILYDRVNSNNNCIIQKLPLSIHDLDAFRYRCESIRCTITQKLVKQARLNELRMEILNSKRLQSHFRERRREFELLRHDKMLQPAEMVKPHMSHIPSYMLSNTQLSNQPKKRRGKYNNSIKEYKDTFGQLPPVMREERRKRRLRRAMRANPVLKRHVLNKRKFNLRHPKKDFNRHKLKNWGFLDNSTLIEKYNKSNAVKDAKVHIPRVKSWKDPLRKGLVKLGRRKPSFRGLAKTQIKKIRKRQKMKKLAKRRK